MSSGSIEVKIPEGVEPLTQGSAESAGWDIRSSQKVTLDPKSPTLLDTGFKCEIQPGFGLLLLSRSKLASEGFTVEGGVIDSDYRGFVKVILHNHTKNPKVIQKGERIAQAWFLPVPHIQWIKANELTTTDRGQHGFGSTGTT